VVRAPAAGETVVDVPAAIVVVTGESGAAIVAIAADASRGRRRSTWTS